MNIHLQYFAQLRERRGLSEETLSTSATTPRELYRELKTLYDFNLCSSEVKVAKGDDFCDWDTLLNEGDTITFLPPVGGG